MFIIYQLTRSFKPPVLDGIDFVGPEPSLLTFTSGQSIGDVQCANVTVLDDDILNGRKNLSIKLANYGGVGSGVRIDDNMPSINVNVIIDGDTGDGKIMNACIHNIIIINSGIHHSSHSGFVTVNLHSIRA